jgi:predicted dehydrogenase
MSPLRYMVIGVGALGRHHARIAAGMDGVELVAVADPHEQQGRAVADQHGAKWVGDYRQMLDQVDAVSVVVPTFLHRQVTCDCLSAGIPTLVEKPLAANLDDARAIVAAARRQQTLLQVGHIERFNPAFRETLSRVSSPKYIRAERFSPYAFRSMDIGAVHDLMIHDIDLVLTLADAAVTGVEAFGVCVLGGHEDSVNARLRFANGCVADLTANRVCPTFRRHLHVWSADGCVDANLHTREVTHYRPSARLLAGELPYELAQQPGADIAQLKEAVFGEYIEVETPTLAERDQLTDEISSFVESIRTRRRPAVDADAGLAAVEVAERIVDAVQQHRWTGSGAGAVGPHIGPTQPMPQRRAA